MCYIQGKGTRATILLCKQAAPYMVGSRISLYGVKNPIGKAQTLCCPRAINGIARVIKAHYARHGQPSSQ